jgi:hypothetical protein
MALRLRETAIQKEDEMIKLLWPACLLLLTSCAAARATPPKAAIAPEALDAARSIVTSAAAHIDAYVDDPLSAFEGPEIEAVKRDIAAMEDETEDAKFIEEAKALEQDWDALVGLDKVLQRECAI